MLRSRAQQREKRPLNYRPYLFDSKPLVREEGSVVISANCSAEHAAGNLATMVDQVSPKYFATVLQEIDEIRKLRNEIKQMFGPNGVANENAAKAVNERKTLVNNRLRILSERLEHCADVGSKTSQHRISDLKKSISSFQSDPPIRQQPGNRTGGSAN